MHGSEMLYVIEGEDILTAFVDETGSKQLLSSLHELLASPQLERPTGACAELYQL
jgi:hypothetical protein